MLYNVVGCKIVDFVNDEKERVQGVRLYTTHFDEEDDSFYGQMTSSFFISVESKHYLKIRDYVERNDKGFTPDDLIGQDVDLEFNESGKMRVLKLLSALDEQKDVDGIAKLLSDVKHGNKIDNKDVK